MDLAVANSFEFLKAVIYFVLFVSLVNTPARLRRLLACLAVFTAVLALLAVVNYHTAGDEVAAAVYMHENERDDGRESQDRKYGPVLEDNMIDPATGELIHIYRLCGVGIFKDPNDMGLALVIGLVIALYEVSRSEAGVFRFLWLPLTGLFGYSLALTQSRGAFVALMGGLAAFFYARFGLRKSLLLGALALPVLLFFFGGRMTSISTGEGTGQSRVQLWSDGLDLFKESPLFGIGVDQYRQRLSFVAHNSYLHCYTELGLLGGTLFLGAFSLAVRMLFRSRQRSAMNGRQSLLSSRLSPQAADSSNSQLLRLFPIAFAVLVAYMTGILFLSRSYVVPTYTILGVAAAYLGIAEPFALRARPRIQIRALWHLAGTSVGFVGGFFVLIRILAH
jgi:O-antigen ligase